MARNQIIWIIVLAVVALIIFDPGTREWALGSLGIGSRKKGDGLSNEITKDAGDSMVRVTRFDNVYHVKTCSELQGKASMIFGLDKAKEIYTPCPKCNPPR